MAPFKTCVTLICLFASALLGIAAQPAITGFTRDGRLSWVAPGETGEVVIESATNLFAGNWEPAFYDFPSSLERSFDLPISQQGRRFFRIRLQTAPPDPSLIFHLPFDNDIADGTVIDASGNENHGLRYGHLSSPTNWPSLVRGADGGLAAEFRWYMDGWGAYNRSGDYIGMPTVKQFRGLTQATICGWASYYTSPDNNYLLDHNATIMNAGFAYPGAWKLGRNSSPGTRMVVHATTTQAFEVSRFPDDAPQNGNSGGWHHYVVTFSNGVFRSYFDGASHDTATIPITALDVGGYYLGISCWTFNRSPLLDPEVDLYPNNGWMNGALDDLRIYRRVLTPEEISNLYYSFDKEAPTVPVLGARTAAGTQVELRWAPAKDRSGVASYTLRRDGVAIGETPGIAWVDTTATPLTRHGYTIDALDILGNRSEPSAPLDVLTPGTGSGVDVIVDDGDGGPWGERVGQWNAGNALAGFWGSGYLGDGNAGKGEKSFTFRPVLPEPGEYQVRIQFPGWTRCDTNVPVRIRHSGGETARFVNQRRDGGKWVSFGSFRFEAGTDGSVLVENVGTTGYVFADAVRFTKN